MGVFMRKRKAQQTDPILDKLDAINSTLVDLFILQAKLAGIKKDRVRIILAVGADRITRVWPHVGKGAADQQ
jgi:hypothetical protein